jgi:PepSY-associated transmembrane protein
VFSIIHKWHKKFGVFVALFVILIVISGIALNHSQQIKLNTNYIQSEWLLDLYQINPASDPVGFQSSDIWVSQVGERIYFNKSEIAKDVSKLIGSVFINGLFVIAFDGQLTLLTNTGEVIEHLTGAEGVPAGMEEIANDDQDNVIIKAAHGFYKVNLDVMDWNESDYLDANWISASPIPDQLKSDLLKQYRGSGLTIERVLLDLHSGRIVGSWGVYIVDLMALLFLFLALSGVWMWWVRK